VLWVAVCGDKAGNREVINNKLYARRSHVQIAGAALLLLCGISAYLLSIGELIAVVAWWFVIGILLPILLLSRLVKSFVLHIVIGIAFVTQIVSVPLFVINRDSYAYSGWNAVKDFSFTVSEFVQIYSLIALFLVVVVFCVVFLLKVLRLPQFSIGPDMKKSTLPFAPQRKKRRTDSYLILLIVAILLLLPLNLWMFRNGISLVGVEPPRLPYRLSGILHYFAKYVVPAALVVIYAKTSRSYVPACILLVYAFLLGASQISRSLVVFLILPVVYFAFLDRRHVLISLSVIYGLASIQLVSLLRNVVYLVSDSLAGGESAVGLVESFRGLIEFHLEHFSIGNTFVSMMDRLDGVQSIVLAYQFNADAVGGVMASFQRFFYQGWVPIDMDAYHLEWIGTTLPKGFVSAGGGLLSVSLVIAQSQPLYIALFAAIVAVFIVFGEGVARAIRIKYKVPIYYYVVGGIYTLFFYIGPGTLVFFGILTILIIVMVMPRYSKGFFRYRRQNN